jgi:hypothetical protein
MTQRHRERKERMNAEKLRHAQVLDPAVPADKLAELLAEEYEGGPVSGYLGRMLVDRGSSPERLAEAARLLMAADDALPGLSFAAVVAGLEGNAERERLLLDQVIALAGDDPELRRSITQFVLTSGHPVDAVDLLAPVLRKDPADEGAVEQYGVALEAAYQLVSEGGGTRERELLDRFSDRSGWTELRDAVNAYLDGTELGAVVRDRVARDLYSAGDLGPVGLAAMVEDAALLTTGLNQKEVEQAESVDEIVALGDESDIPVLTFAADPATPPVLAARAKDWHEHIQYGLWQLDGREPAPGFWVTEIVTGARRYAEFPPGVFDRVPRWAVWFGALVPVDGIWHCTGAGMLLSPAEGDAAAEYVEVTMLRLLYMNDMSALPQPQFAPGVAEPRGVDIADEDPAVDAIVVMYSQVTCAVTVELALEVAAYRRDPRLPWASAGYERDWVDGEVPALMGKTPRRAARGKERNRLEALLRQFEYDGYVRGDGFDTAWLRGQLDMPEDVSP